MTQWIGSIEWGVVVTTALVVWVSVIFPVIALVVVAKDALD